MHFLEVFEEKKKALPTNSIITMRKTTTECERIVEDRKNTHIGILDHKRHDKHEEKCTHRFSHDRALGDLLFSMFPYFSCKSVDCR